MNNKWEMDIETIDNKPEEILEENVYVDESFIKNKALIRMDMNIIQFPIFSKTTKRKANQIVKYYFNKNRDTYITVKPIAGESIPGEMEERVFIALMQIMKERNMPKKFIVKSTELKNKLKLKTNRYYSLLKKSLLKLSETNYNFKNTLYSSEKNGVIKEEVSTPILSLRIITLSLKENIKLKEMVDDSRIKEVYEITMTDHFYNNIIQKGYMVYNGDLLLEIESSIARTIYMLVEKLRFDNLYLKLDVIFLIKRIPLKISKKNMVQTINTLEKSLQELVNKKLIENFKFIKESTWEKAEIEIFFNENSNEDKKDRFFTDRNDFRKILTSNTISNEIHEMVEEIELDNIDKSIKVTNTMINNILSLMPTKAKELKTMPKTIKEAIENYGYKKVELVSIYMKKNKVEKIRAYFLKALENDWHDDENIIKIDEKPLKKTIKPLDDVGVPQYNEMLYNEFERLPIDIKNGIETYTYREYIKECGIETKIQKIAFAGSRKKYICEFLEKYPEILNDSTKDQSIQEEKNIQEEIIISENIEDINTIKEMIEEAIQLADMVFSYSETEKKELILKILKEVIPLKNLKKLTLEKLNEIIRKYIKI